jgi:hypothetical protein
MFLRSRKGIQSDKYIKKRRKKIILVSILFIVAVGSVITSLSLLSKADFLQITSVEITGTNLVSADSIKTIVENNLTGDWWNIFSKDSFFLYPRNALRLALVKDFPPVASVSFSHTGFHILNVAITERSPFALACDKSTMNVSPPSCFYMDSTGFIYAPAPQFSPGVYVTYTVASSTTVSTSVHSPITVGSYVTDPADFEIATHVVNYISILGLTVIGVNVPTAVSDDDFQMYIGRPASANTASSSPVITVYFNLSQPIDKTLEYFSAFWQHETDKNFQYIDLRYGKDIVFKME